jgi:hypothetical protein
VTISVSTTDDAEEKILLHLQQGLTIIVARSFLINNYRCFFHTRQGMAFFYV